MFGFGLGLCSCGSSGDRVLDVKVGRARGGAAVLVAVLVLGSRVGRGHNRGEAVVEPCSRSCAVCVCRVWSCCSISGQLLVLILCVKLH